MFNLDRWIEIFQTIRKNKLRTALSGFTIAFAILLFTLLFGIGNGLKNTFEREFAKDSMLSIYIWTGTTTKPFKGLQSGRRIQFKNDDYKFLVDKYGDKMQTISPRIQRNNVQAIYKGEQNKYTFRAVYPNYLTLESAELESGRFLNMLDLQKKSKVIVIGRLVEQDLFGQLSALGKEINLGGISYKVIGTFSDPGGDGDERYIYGPFTTVQRLYGNNDELGEFGITYDPKLSVDEAIMFGNQMSKSLKEKHSVDPRDQGAIRVNNYAEGNKQVSIMM